MNPSRFQASGWARERQTTLMKSQCPRPLRIQLQEENHTLSIEHLIFSIITCSWRQDSDRVLLLQELGPGWVRKWPEAHSLED